MWQFIANTIVSYLVWHFVRSWLILSVNNRNCGGVFRVGRRLPAKLFLCVCECAHGCVCVSERKGEREKKERERERERVCVCMMASLEKSEFSGILRSDLLGGQWVPCWCSSDSKTVDNCHEGWTAACYRLLTHHSMDCSHTCSHLSARPRTCSPQSNLRLAS